MESIIHLTNDEDLLKCPKKIAEFINVLAVKAVEDESILLKVQGLDVIKPVLRKSAEEESSNQLNFLNILHGLLIPYMNDPESIHLIIEEVHDCQVELCDDRETKYFKLAHEFLKQLHEGASIFKNELVHQAETLDGILNRLISQKCIDDEQTEFLNQLLEKYNASEEVDTHQFRLLAKLREELIERELWQINQSEEINRIRLVNETLVERIGSLEELVGRLGSQIKDNNQCLRECKMRMVYCMSGFVIVLAVLLIKVFL